MFLYFECVRVKHPENNRKHLTSCALSRQLQWPLLRKNIPLLFMGNLDNDLCDPMDDTEYV